MFVRKNGKCVILEGLHSLNLSSFFFLSFFLSYFFLSLSSHVIALQEVRNKRMREVERLMITWDEWEKSWEEEEGKKKKGRRRKEEREEEGKDDPFHSSLHLLIYPHLSPQFFHKVTILHSISVRKNFTDC